MKTIVAFALGVVVGAVAALLLAPESGSELRSQISQEAAKDRERAQQSYKSAVHGAHDQLDHLQSRMHSKTQEEVDIEVEETVEVDVEE